MMADAPSPPPTKGQTRRQAARTFLSLLWHRSDRRGLVALLALSLAGSVAEGAGLLLLVPVLDMIGVNGGAPPTASALLPGLALYLLLVILGAGVVGARNIVAEGQRTAFVDRLRRDLHAALLHVSWPAFQSLRSTDIKQIMTGEVGRLALCHLSLVNLVVTLLTLPALLGAALLISPALTLATLLVSLLSLLLLRHIGKSGFDIGRRLGRAHQDVMADLTDDLAGLRVIRIFGAETARQDNLARRFADLRRLQARHVRIQAYEQAALLIIAAALAAAAVIVSTLWLRQDLGSALAVILAFARLAQRGLGGLRVWRQLESGLPAVLLLQEMLTRLRAAAEPAAAGSDLPPFSRLLSFQGVGLRTADGRQALDGVDFDLPFGALIAVTGPSGAGKSTLADIAAGLAPPSCGSLTVDGRELTPDLRAAWRRQVAVVPQDPFLFHDTIRANLLLAAPHAGEPDLWAALTDAAAADFVRALPHGLDTVVGDRGGAVSGGERQRLALARALLRHPRLLILDEATSALDAASEALVLQALERLRGRTTILAVTHREQTRRAADLVLALEAGRVVRSA